MAGEELDDDVIDALHERTHGIPFYVEELAATLALHGRRDAGGLPLPETVLDAVLLRTEALSLPARNALEKAAVVGQRCEIQHVEALGADALTEALAAGFLVDAGPGCLEFRHALVRDAVYHAIPWTRRRSLHTSVARLLEQAGAPAAERATQWLGAGNVERARLRWPRPPRPPSGSSPIATPPSSTNARSISTAARSRCASSCSSVWP